MSTQFLYQIFVGEELSVVNDQQLNEVVKHSGRILSIRKSGDFWAWSELHGSRVNIHVKNSNSKESQHIIVSDSQNFDLSTSGTLFEKQLPTNGDIYRTVHVE